MACVRRPMLLIRDMCGVVRGRSTVLRSLRKTPLVNFVTLDEFWFLRSLPFFSSCNRMIQAASTLRGRSSSQLFLFQLKIFRAGSSNPWLSHLVRCVSSLSRTLQNANQVTRR